MEMDRQDEAHAHARDRVEQKLGLVAHWLVYLVVNVGLILGAGGLDGSAWRLLGWGVGLAAHTLYVAGRVGGLRERMLQRELARIARER